MGATATSENRTQAVNNGDAAGKNRCLESNGFQFTVNGQEYVLQIANTPWMREAAYRLMYDIYADKGWAHDPSRMWFSLYELLPTAITLIVTQAETVVACMTVVFDSPFGLPDEETYPDEIAALRASGNPSQIISFGTREDLRGSWQILGKMFNTVHMLAWRLKGSTHFVHTVVPKHAVFYEHQLLFSKLGPERRQEKTGVDVQLMQMALKTMDEVPDATRRRTFFRFYMDRAEETPILESFQKAIDPVSSAEFEYFMEKKPKLWSKATGLQKDFLLENVINTYRENFRTIPLQETRPPTRKFMRIIMGEQEMGALGMA